MAAGIHPGMKALGQKRALLEGCSILDTHRHCFPFVALRCLELLVRQQNLRRCHLTEGMAACFRLGCRSRKSLIGGMAACSLLGRRSRRSCRGCRGCRSCRSHKSYRRLERHLRHLTRHSTESAEQVECYSIRSLAGIPLAGVAQPPG